MTGVRAALLCQLTSLPERVGDPDASFRFAGQGTETRPDLVREPLTIRRQGVSGEEGAWVGARDERAAVTSRCIERVEPAALVDHDLALLEQGRRSGPGGRYGGVAERTHQGREAQEREGDGDHGCGDPPGPLLPVTTVQEPIEGGLGDGNAAGDAF